jgi:hypothetical protein
MRGYGWAGVVILLVAEYGLLRRIEPFVSWFYCFAWWSYVLLADNLLLKVRGRSLFGTRRAELARMLPLSVFIWLVFEAYNLVIRNWGYSGIPPQTWLRWPGYAVSFATVLPGIFITSDLLQWMFGWRQARAASEAEPMGASPSTRPSASFVVIGLALSIAPLIWPRFFFPAVWIGPIFLLDPLLEKFGVRNLSVCASLGNRRRAWSLLAGGFACGALWEFWNFWAASKWIYSVPYFQHWKIFEMPLPGFLGFPPFAVECWIMYHLLRAAGDRCRTPAARAAYWSAIVLFCLVMFHEIDTHTVLSYARNRAGSLTEWVSGSF